MEEKEKYFKMDYRINERDFNAYYTEFESIEDMTTTEEGGTYRTIRIKISTALT